MTEQITTVEELEAFARFAVETLQSERRTDTDDGDSWAAEQIEDAAPTLAALDAYRPDRPVGLSVEAEFDTFVRSFNGDEAGDIDDVSALDGNTGWAMRGGNDVRAVFEKARAAMPAPPSGVVSTGQVEHVAQIVAEAALDWVDVEGRSGHEHSLACTNWTCYQDEARAILAALGLNVEGASS